VTRFEDDAVKKKRVLEMKKGICCPGKKLVA